MDFPLVVFGTVLVTVLGGATYLGIKESHEWDAFKVAHSCKVVSRISGDVYIVNGFDSKGNMTTGTAVSPDKIGYLCDDGVTYYR